MEQEGVPETKTKMEKAITRRRERVPGVIVLGNLSVTCLSTWYINSGFFFVLILIVVLYLFQFWADFEG